MNEFRSNPCVEVSHKHCACIEFVLSDQDRQGFQASQLLHYRLATNDDDGKDAPPEKLSIAYATADVTLTGWRLDRITEHLRDGNLLAVRSRPSRYLSGVAPANTDGTLNPTVVFVSDINVVSVGKE